MPFSTPRVGALCPPLLVSLLLAACGGGGSSADVTPPASSHVSVTAFGPSAAVASGSAAVIDIVVINSGTLAATNVRAAAQLGAGLTLLSVTCSGAGGATCPADPATLIAASVPAGASLRYQLTTAVATGKSGSIVSAVAVQADGETPSADSAAAVAFNSFTADLVASGAPPSAAVASGGTAVYTLTVANVGPDAASDVGLEVVVGTRQRLGTITCTAIGGAQCPATQASAMRVPALPANASLVFHVSTTVDVQAAGTIDSTLVVSTAGDPVPGNNVKTVQAQTVATVAAGTPSYVVLQSDAGDFIGQGATLSYTQADAVLTVSAVGNRLNVSVSGDEMWSATFALPASLASLQPGTYPNVTRYPFDDPAVGGLDWSGEGRACNQLGGTIVVDSVAYAAGQLAAVDLRFDQHCENGAPALHGRMHWVAGDPTVPPGPMSPPPAGLWSPPAGAVPSSGNYIYVQSDANEFVGQGQSFLFTPATAQVLLTATGGHASVMIDFPLGWKMDFVAMNSIAQLQPGYYGALHRYPFHNPARGGLDVSGLGSGCNTLSGWFVVDSVGYAGNAIASLDLRFEQHCEGLAPSLHGKIHWVL